MNHSDPAGPRPGLPPRTDGLASVALVLGLLSIFCVTGPLTGIPAMICGLIAGRRIARAKGTLGGGGLALAGSILGLLGTLLVAAISFVAYQKFGGIYRKGSSLVHQVSETAWVMDVATDVREYRRELGAWPTQQAIGGEELDAASVLAAFQSREKLPKPIPSTRIKEGKLIDRWGHPLHIAADLNDDGNITIGTGDVEDLRVIVWSDGPDGRNDYGEGDDIRSW